MDFKKEKKKKKKPLLSPSVSMMTGEAKRVE